MKKPVFNKKLKQQNGETLIETLCSLLIALLSVLLLSTAVMTATNINTKTREADEKYQSELKAVEGLETHAPVATATLSVTFHTMDGATIYESTSAQIVMYGSAEGSFLSYDYMPEVDVP